MSNRIPSEPNEKYHVFLVSLEGSLNELPTENQIQYLTKPPVTKSKMEVSERLAGVKKATNKGTNKSSSNLRRSDSFILLIYLGFQPLRLFQL